MTALICTRFCPKCRHSLVPENPLKQPASFTPLPRSQGSLFEESDSQQPLQAPVASKAAFPNSASSQGQSHCPETHVVRTTHLHIHAVERKSEQLFPSRTSIRGSGGQARWGSPHVSGQSQTQRKRHFRLSSATDETRVLPLERVEISMPSTTSGSVFISSSAKLKQSKLHARLDELGDRQPVGMAG